MFRIEVVYEMKNERCKVFVNILYFIFIFFSEWYVMDRGRIVRLIIRLVVVMFSKKRLKGECNVLNGFLIIVI